jgi:regulation of enolase protein 1 (concanavalin A-like superfamily)
MTKKILAVAAVLSVPLLLVLWRQVPHLKSPRPILAEPQAAPLAIQVSRMPSTPAAGRFHRWAQDYTAATGAERPAMLDVGRQLARGHRERMKVLISADPRRAMDEALPVRWRQELPPEITDMIEQRVNARGRYAVRGVLGDSPGIRRSFETAAGVHYEARVYGRRVHQRTTENAAAHGVALDGVVALADDPLRIMEPGERVSPGQSVSFTCPVSEKETPQVKEIAPETPAVEWGGGVHFLCSGGHVHALRELALAAEGGAGGPSKPTGPVPSSWVTGAKSVLYIRVTFPDQWTDPQPEKECYEMMQSVNDFMAENSHGALHFLTTVTPLIMMPKPAAWYAANDSSSADAILTDARVTARAAGFDFSSYDLEAVRYSGAAGSFNGQAYVGSRGVWLKTSSAGVAAHEFGHNLGLWHANYWNTGDESSIGSGTNAEYGNSFDTMGSANAGNYWFNAGHQNDLGWIPDSNTTRVTASGLYRLHQFDQPRIDPAARYLLKIARDAERDYWCEFRQRWTSNAWLRNGVLLNWSPWGYSDASNTAYGSNAGGQLLDTTPGSLDAKSDSSVVLGRTFSDTGARIHITPVSKVGTSPESVEVMVQLGDFPGNQVPSLHLEATALTAAVNETLTFTAAALDPDGDPLAFSWDWGDRTFGANAAVVEKSWSSAGLYTVRCEVSDMRGGTRSALLPVTVGAPAGVRISGRVLAADGTPVTGARVSGVKAGTSNTNRRLCLTDSEGRFILSGLPDDDYTLTAVHEQFAITAGFTNPVTASGQDLTAAFTAVRQTAVAISLPDNSCREGGDGAVLRFTRLADSNSGALTVRLFVGGAAAMGDVRFTPAETYELTTYTFTLPDGGDILDVAVAAENDTTAEGPETMTFHLVDGAGYVPSGAEAVTLLIDDNDTSLPVVSLTAADDSALEGGHGAMLRLSRTGPVTTPLAVGISRTGSATANSDYTGINATATIPPGSASVDLPLTALPDSAVEGTETATFSISSSASWIRSPLAISASVQILDEDIPIVTVTAADNDADESGSDPAVFLFTRTGDTGAPLTVDYAVGGSAHHGTDYWPLSGTVTLPAGLNHAALVVTPVDDEFGEPPQTVSVQIRSTTRYAAGESCSASAAIADNDLSHLMATVSDGSCDEAGGAGKFRIQSYGTGAGSITVNYTLSGTATESADYSPPGGSISVPRSGYAEITVTPLQDEEYEDLESIVLALTPDAAYSLSPERTATMAIVDDDQPHVSVAQNSGSGVEDGETLRFQFTRTGSTTEALTVHYSLAGDATSGADYTAPPGFAVIPAGSQNTLLELELINDSDAEGSESVICAVVASPGIYGVGSGPSVQWILDSDESTLTRASFVSGTSSFAESAGTAPVAVKLSAASSSEVAVEYSLNSGSAFHGVDYGATGGTLVFAPGETQQIIPVTINDDDFREPPETVGFRLVRATRAQVNGTTSHVLTITDNDAAPPPSAGFTAASSVAGEGSATPPGALIYLSAPQSAPVSLTWEVTGGTATAEDAAALSGTLTFQPGETAKPVPLQITDDSDQEPVESFVLTLSDPVAPLTLASSVTHAVTVSDNDDTVITIVSPDNSAAEQGSDPATFTLQRTALDITQPVTVQLSAGGSAAAGADYSALPPEITIPAGETAVTLSVVPLDDAVVDPDETVVLAIVASPFFAVGSSSTATVTILDNETGIAVSAADPIAGEPNDPGRFVITRSGRTAGELIVPLTAGGTAVPGEDYTPLPAEAVLADGETTVTVDVMPLEDATAEPLETITLIAAPGPGYTVTLPAAQITLLDDDTNLAPVVAIVSPAAADVILPAGPGLVLEAEVTDDGRPAPATPPAVNWSALSGPGAVSFGDAASANTTAQFSTPGHYQLRLTAADAELSTPVNLSVLVLSDTLTGSNIGHSSTLTGLAGGGDSWTLTGLGSTVSTGTSDSTYFAHRHMTGDFTLTARVVSIGSSNTSARCGVMIRSDPGDSARHAFMSMTPNRRSFVYRSTEGASGSANNSNQQNPLPRFVRLRREGDIFTAEHSPDGQAWTQQGSPQAISMPDPVYAGLVATSASSSATVLAVFDNFSITPSGNVGPFVHAGSSQSTGFSALLGGTVTDDDTAAIRWEKRSGPGDVTLPDSPAGDAIFSAPGTYELRLFANDGEVETFADTTVQVRSPFSTWQTLHFGSDAGDPDIAGPRADPDFDGLENLAEFALISDPLKPDAGAAPVSSRTATAFSMTWRESAAAGDVQIEPQWSDDISNWNSGDLLLETLASGAGWVEKRATLDVSDRPRAVLRLLVSLPQ